ncbi:MAG: lipase [Rhodoferax sp.]|nr:lipase [Rhodoferax sp.]
MVQGTSDPTCQGWVGRVGAAAWNQGYALTLHNLGIRGATSADVSARWRAEALARLQAGSHKYLVFCFGANDTTRLGEDLRVPLARSLAHFSRTVSDAQLLHPTRVVGPFPVGEATQDARTRELCARYAERARALGVHYLPVAGQLMDSSLWRDDVAASDGCHPGAAGYQLVADMVCAWSAWWFRSSTSF